MRSYRVAVSWSCHLFPSSSETAQLPFRQSHLSREETWSALKMLTSGRKIFFLSGGRVPFNTQPGCILHGGEVSGEDPSTAADAFGTFAWISPGRKLSHEPRMVQVEQIVFFPPPSLWLLSCHSAWALKAVPSDKGLWLWGWPTSHPAIPAVPSYTAPTSAWTPLCNEHTQRHSFCVPQWGGTAGLALPASISELFAITHYILNFTVSFHSFMTAVPFALVVPNPYYC